MKGRKALIAIAIVGALAIPASVFAANSDSTAAKTIRGFFGIDTTKLTDTQKADITDYTQKMAALEKEFINKMVSNGTLTQEKADAAITRIDKEVANGTYVKGMGGELRGKGGPNGMDNRGSMGMFGIDYSKLTDTQKSDFTATFEKIAALQKTLINKEVEFGLITQQQADDTIKRIDESSSINNGAKGFMGGFKGFGMMRTDISKLTAEQKTFFDDYSTQLKELQKELISKAVANNTITQDQADNALKMIENMPGVNDMKNYNKGNGVGKRGTGERMSNGNINSSSAASEIK